MASLAVLFDLDGTLIDSLPDITGVINDIRASYSLGPLDLEQVRPFVGEGVEFLMDGCLGDLSASLDVSRKVELYRGHYAEFEFVGRLYPEVAQTLNRLRQNPEVALAVVTNRLTDLAVKSVRHYLPGFRFDRIAGPDAVSRKKPDPAHILEVLEGLGIPPQKAWFVGDHEVDRECARRAGVAFFGAAYGLSGVEVDPSRRLERFSELLEKLPGIG